MKLKLDSESCFGICFLQLVNEKNDRRPIYLNIAKHIAIGPPFLNLAKTTKLYLHEF